MVNIETSQTRPPLLLNEADLIALMDKYGIGTDATHAEHIEKIKQRTYVALNEDNRFVPSFLGLALVDAYNRMGYEMSKPHLRANLEQQLVEICNGNFLIFFKRFISGRRNKVDVLSEQVNKYKRIFEQTEDKINLLSTSFQTYLNSRNNNNPN